MLYRFRGHLDGARPASDLLEVHGEFYGTTSEGGSDGRKCFCGTVFSVDGSGNEKILYRFKGGGDGANPESGLIFVGGTFYGTTSFGGAGSCSGNSYSGGCGTIFSFDASGRERIVYNFSGGTGGQYPQGKLLPLNGKLYGTTESGGLPSCGCGTVFAIDMAGHGGPIYSFTGGNDGGLPATGLTAIGGTLYGTTTGGSCGFSGGKCGSVYDISPSGQIHVDHTFSGSDGGYPWSNLVSLNGVLYGTTYEGGNGCVISGCGTLYSIDKTGTERVLWLFGGNNDGAKPVGKLAVLNGEIYGTTQAGGNYNCAAPYGCGTVYRFDPSVGREFKLHDFALSEGIAPSAGVIARRSTLYATANQGGLRTWGSVFSLVP